MGEILGIGCTHTGLNGTAEGLRATWSRRRALRLQSPDLRPEFKDPENWPPQMRAEIGDDDGAKVAETYWNELVRGFREARKAIDDFDPDFVLIYGDDQYEAIREDLVPPFTVFAIPELESKRRSPSGDEGGAAQVPTIKGHTTAANHIVSGLIREGFDISCSWRLPNGEAYGHAFVNTVDYLSFDGQGFPWPVVPLAVNCYGVGLRVPSDRFPDPNETPPPSPAPWRCYDLGKTVARIIQDSPWRAVIIGSSSWSHAFLTANSSYLWPDVDADRARGAELRSGEFAKWRELDPEQILDSGQHEFLNWACLAGSMEGREAEIIAYCEAYIFNSTRVIARFPVPGKH